MLISWKYAIIEAIFFWVWVKKEKKFFNVDIRNPSQRKVTFDLDIEGREIKISQSENEGRTFQFLIMRYKIIYISLKWFIILAEIRGFVWDLVEKA